MLNILPAQYGQALLPFAQDLTTELTTAGNTWSADLKQRHQNFLPLPGVICAGVIGALRLG